MSARTVALRTVIALYLAISWVAAAHTQADRFTGRWVASEPDRGVLVSLTLGASNSLTVPGGRQDGSTQALTLGVVELMTRGDVASFEVELPQNEGIVEFEFRITAAGDSGTLRVVRVDGEAPDDDIPNWILRKSN